VLEGVGHACLVPDYDEPLVFEILLSKLINLSLMLSITSFPTPFKSAIKCFIFTPSEKTESVMNKMEEILFLVGVENLGSRSIFKLIEYFPYSITVYCFIYRLTLWYRWRCTLYTLPIVDGYSFSAGSVNITIINCIKKL
jgi:hypothetical protein